MNGMSRSEQLSGLAKKENWPKFRLEQIERALFDARIGGWAGITTLGKKERESLAAVPFYSFSRAKVLESRDGASKSLLELLDGQKIETVLMPNARGGFTICLSTQVGCARACSFCATGTMGLVRNLSVDEIVDQYRFWARRKITNLVFMGMGEPLDNYENVKAAINLILKYTEIGPTHITVSTVGVWPALDNILTDADWPPVRLAISLHGADKATRQKIAPSSPLDFFEKLTDWSKKYLAEKGNRRHYLTFEYIMIGGVNDSLRQAEKLTALVKEIGRVRVNLVPCNPAMGGWQASSAGAIRDFQVALKKEEIMVTVRRSMGQDILAACGQLAAR